MKKVFHFDAPRDKYHCDAAILWCFDNRFELGFRKFLKRIGVMNSDPIKIAGGAKCLASPDHESDREFVLEQIRKSMKLHGTRRVILMVHSDCGAYGGLAGGFGGDAAAEAEHHEREFNAQRIICGRRSQASRYRGISWTLRVSGTRRSEGEQKSPRWPDAQVRKTHLRLRKPAPGGASPRLLRSQGGSAAAKTV